MRLFKNIKCSLLLIAVFSMLASFSAEATHTLPQAITTELVVVSETSHQNEIFFVLNQSITDSFSTLSDFWQHSQQQYITQNQNLFNVKFKEVVFKRFHIKEQVTSKLIHFPNNSLKEIPLG